VHLFDEELSRLVREVNALRGGSHGRPAREGLGGDVLDGLLRRVVETGASDLLVVPGAPATARIDGKLVSLDPMPLDPEAVRMLVLEVADERTRASIAARRSADFCVDRPGIGRFRCNAHWQRGSLAAAFRAFPRDIPSLAALGLPEVLARFASLDRGLVLFAGPTGCGKSTTLASLVDIVNRTRAVHVVTLEDPVEYVHRHGGCVIEQIEIGRDAPTFAEALRSSLRQDPDVLLVGEMRDLETISLALTAAETGHLVFSTLHTGTAAQTLDRIVDVFPDHQQAQIRSQVALSLAGVVVQHLIPRREGRGRVPAVEVLLANDGVRNLIRRGMNHQIPTQITMGRAEGMISLEESLARLVKSGAIARAEGLKRSAHPEEFEGYLR
jgi:twitching motility protein PilT